MLQIVSSRTALNTESSLASAFIYDVYSSQSKHCCVLACTSVWMVDDLI